MMPNGTQLSSIGLLEPELSKSCDIKSKPRTKHSTLMTLTTQFRHLPVDLHK